MSLVKIVSVFKDPYTRISKKHIAFNKELSLQEKGLLLQLHSLKDDGHINMTSLNNFALDGEKATRNAFKSLKKKGFVKQSCTQSDTGQWHWTLEVYQEPLKEPVATFERNASKVLPPSVDYEMLAVKYGLTVETVKNMLVDAVNPIASAEPQQEPQEDEIFEDLTIDTQVVQTAVEPQSQESVTTPQTNVDYAKKVCEDRDFLQCLKDKKVDTSDIKHLLTKFLNRLKKDNILHEHYEAFRNHFENWIPKFLRSLEVNKNVKKRQKSISAEDCMTEFLRYRKLIMVLDAHHTFERFKEDVMTYLDYGKRLVALNAMPTEYQTFYEKTETMWKTSGATQQAFEKRLKIAKEKVKT